MKKKTDWEENAIGYAGIPTKLICMKEYYELNKDRWYCEERFLWFFWRKIPNRPWWEYYCSKHKRTHEKDH